MVIATPDQPVFIESTVAANPMAVEAAIASVLATDGALRVHSIEIVPPANGSEELLVRVSAARTHEAPDGWWPSTARVARVDTEEAAASMLLDLHAELAEVLVIRTELCAVVPTDGSGCYAVLVYRAAEL